MTISYNVALQLCQAIIKKAENNAEHVAVAVTDAHGSLISFIKMDEVGQGSGHLAQCKAYTAAREQQPTLTIGTWARENNYDHGYWADSKVCLFGGGVPITINSKIVGAIGVSGLTQEADHDLASWAIKQVSAR